jgi:hypothetical protein
MTHVAFGSRSSFLCRTPMSLMPSLATARTKVFDLADLNVCSVLPLQPTHDFVELIEAAIADCQAAAAIAVLDADREPERVG